MYMASLQADFSWLTLT